MPITSAKDFNYIIISFYKGIILLAKTWRLLFSWQHKLFATTSRFYTDDRKQNLFPSIHFISQAK